MNQLILINFQEWIRLKFFRIIFFLSIVFVLFSYLLGSLSFTEQQRLIADFGLAGIEFSLVFIACFFASHCLSKDIDRKTILVVLSRPIARWKIILSYFFSLALLNASSLLILGITLFLILGQTSSLEMYLISLLVIYFKSLVIAATGLLFGVISRSMFAFVMSLTLWFLSYGVEDLQFFLKKIEASQVIIQLTNFVVPQFYKFNWKNYGFLKLTDVPADIYWVFLHCFSWTVLILIMSFFFFRKKEIL